VTPDETRVGAAATGQVIAGAPASTATSIAAEAASKAAGENFPVALRVLPKGYRGHLAALYGFARSADDMGDEAPAAERLALLDELEADVHRLYRSVRAETQGSGTDGPRLSVVRALAPAVAERAIPPEPFLDLIQANRQDQAVTRYPVFEDLLAYCTLSANPVGRAVLHIFGAATPDRVALSDLVCTALQLAEHWQDVAEDLRAGRIYLPRADMERFGCSEADLARDTAPPQLRQLMGYEVRRATDMLDKGAPIVGTLRGAARLAVAGYVAGGRAALAAIKASGYDVLAATPRPRPRRVVAELVRAYATGR
jgi:squalene synthase HpnC